MSVNFLRLLGPPVLGPVGLTLLTVLLSGCAGGAAPDGEGTLTIGFIYIGARDDYGYSQAHAQGAAAVKKMPGVKVIEEERVPDTTDVQKAMQSMIELDGAKVLFPSSFGYFDPHVLVMAQRYPQVAFLHCGGLYDEKIHPTNISSYFGFIDEGQYLSGIVAGHTTRSKKLGFIAGKPIPQVLRNVNAFTLGALIDQGVDVMTCHVNSPKIIIESAERRGIYTCGYHTNQAELAPRGYLTGAEWNWEKVYVNYLTDIKAGKKPAAFVRGGLKEGFVRTSPYGPAVSDAARRAADGVKTQFMAGSFVIFRGPLKDNAGNLVIPAGTAHGQTAMELERMNYLVEGAIGR